MKHLKKALVWSFAVAGLVVVLSVVALYIAPLQVMQGMAAAQRQAAGVEVLSQDLSHGVSLSYWESPMIGGGQNTLVLVHGITSNKDIWLPMLAALRSDGYTGRVLAVDLPGHGDTVEPQSFDYRVESLALVLSEFLDQQVSGPVHLVGNSLGGLVSGLYASAEPGQVASLVLMNSAGIDAPERSEMMARAMSDRSFNPLLVTAADQLPGKLSAVVASPPSIPAPLLHMMASVEMSRVDKNTALFAAVLGDERNMHKLEALLSEWSQPTLLLWGDSDNIFHASSVAKAMAIQGKKAGVLQGHIIANCGHLPMIEAPLKTAAALTAFWRET